MIKSFYKKLKTNVPMPLLKIIFNFWPPFWGAGIKVKKISPDFRFVEVKMKLCFMNKNYVGTHFGGSIYAMTDPFHMLMVLRGLGNDYIVWDKAGRIEYIKPGRGTLTATFTITEPELDAVREKTANGEKYIFDRKTNILDEHGDIVASVIKTLYVRKKKDRR